MLSVVVPTPQSVIMLSLSTVVLFVRIMTQHEQPMMRSTVGSVLPAIRAHSCHNAQPIILSFIDFWCFPIHVTAVSPQCNKLLVVCKKINIITEIAHVNNQEDRCMTYSGEGETVVKCAHSREKTKTCQKCPRLHTQITLS